MFEEGENDRRHPQSPAQDLNRVFGQFGDALAGKHPPDRRGVALEQRGEERAIDSEQPSRHTPANHAFQRFVEEQFRAAGVSAELDVSPLADQRIKFIRHRLQPKRVVKIELVQHDGNLRVVEIERERGADKRAQPAFHQIHAPGFQPAAVPHAVNQIAQRTDPGINQRARHQTERDALRSRKRRQIHAQRDGGGNANNHAARHQHRFAVGSQCATKKRLAAVKGFDDRLEQWKRHRAGGGEQQRRKSPAKILHDRHTGNDVGQLQKRHQDAAENHALFHSADSVRFHRGACRRYSAHAVHDHSGHHKNLRPQCALREHRGQNGDNRFQRAGQSSGEIPRTQIRHARSNDGRNGGQQQAEMRVHAGQRAAGRGQGKCLGQEHVE